VTIIFSVFFDFSKMKNLKQVIYCCTTLFALTSHEIHSQNTTENDDSDPAWWQSTIANETEASFWSDSSSSFSFDSSSSSSAGCDDNDNNTIRFPSKRISIAIDRRQSGNAVLKTEPRVASIPESPLPILPSIAPVPTPPSNSTSSSAIERAPAYESVDKTQEDNSSKSKDIEVKEGEEKKEKEEDEAISSFQEPPPTYPLTEEEKKQVKEVNAQADREISGKQDQSFFLFAGISGIVGVVALAFVAVHVKHRVASDEAQSGDLSIETEDTHQEIRSSVYNDPLETRFSSIVMMTPDGDGVCVL
jgi:hypothetical protein